MLGVANAQNITVFDFDGVTPIFTNGGGDTFVSGVNPLSDAVNSSANVGKYTKNAQYANSATTANIDSRIYSSYEVSIYSPNTKTGHVQIQLKDSADKQLDWYDQTVTDSTKWIKFTHNLNCTGKVAKVIVNFNYGTAQKGTLADTVYIDNLVFTKSLLATLYSETFSASWSQWGSWTGAPSTKAGSWFGGVNLETNGDANVTLDRWWNAYEHTLKLSQTDSAVTIPNINVAGFDSLKLSFEVTRGGGSALPIVAVKVGAGDWVSVTTLASDAWWGFSGNAQVDLLKDAGGNPINNVSTISLKFSNSPGADIYYDNVKILGKVHSGITTSLTGASKEVFSVYPNPATNYILTPNAQKVSISDLNGRIVSEAFNAEKVDVSSLANGAYIVKVNIDNATKVGKLIKR